jgi:hypothetical protein
MVGGVSIGQNFEAILAFDFQQIADVGEEPGDFMVAKRGIVSSFLSIFICSYLACVVDIEGWVTNTSSAAW